MKWSRLFIAYLVFTACTTSHTNRIVIQNSVHVNVLDSLLNTNPTYFKYIIAQKDTLHVQIIYTQIDRDEHNQPHFTDYTFNLDKNHYFYPASTVKLPVALLSLEKFNQLKIERLNKFTAMITDSSRLSEADIEKHYSAIKTAPTISNYVKQIFLVSDNDAFNRLYEFMGQASIQERLAAKGYPDAEIRHRLEVRLNDEQNRRTNAIHFYDTSGKLLYHQPAQYSNAIFKPKHIQLGKGYISNEKLLNEPFDFSLKNKLYLEDLHHILRSVMFPEAVPLQQKFNLTPADYDFIYRYMSAYPNESHYPSYDSNNYNQAFVKFILYGAQKNAAIPSNIRIFNKVGDAYGFLTDVAYVVDFANKVEFMLSASIYCNSDEIFNDDQYDYESVGYPFMMHIGKVIYDFELQRSRAFIPDLSSFKIDYTKEY